MAGTRPAKEAVDVPTTTALLPAGLTAEAGPSGRLPRAAFTPAGFADRRESS